MSPKKNTARPKKEVVVKEEQEEFVPYTPQPMAFKKAGVVYKEGDSIEITEVDGEQVYGKLINILSSQLIVMPDGSTNPKFFFTSGIKIRKV